MQSKSLRKFIFRCLGSNIKYTCTGVYYWDKKQEKFVLCEGPYYWIWASNYYFGFAFQALFFLFLWNVYEDLFSPEFKETGEKSEEHSTKLLVLVIGALVWALSSCLMAVFSFTMEFREEMCIAQNQIFRLDEQLVKMFITDRELPVPDYPEQKQIEWLMKFDYFTLQTVQILFALAQFIPGEPVHSLMEWMLEIKYGWNWETLLPWSFIVMAINGMMAMGISIVFLVLTGMFGWLFWLRAACPDIHSIRRNWDDGLLYFQTEQLGVVSEKELICFYRSFQLQSALLDIPLSTSRAAYHIFVAQLTLVIPVFALMRFQDVIINGSSLGITFVVVLVTAASVAMILVIIESFALDEVQNRSEKFRNVLLKGTKRNIAVNKAARSFREITLHFAGSYYKVNKSSYIEWCDQAIDRLVTLLCSF